MTPTLSERARELVAWLRRTQADYESASHYDISSFYESRAECVESLLAEREWRPVTDEMRAAWIKACAKAIASVAYLPICEAVRAANRANSLTTPLPYPITEQHQVLAAWADQQATAALSVLEPLIRASAANGEG